MPGCPHRRRRRPGGWPAAVALAALLATGCGGGEPDRTAIDRDTLSQRQRDSLTAESGLPGARGVGRALDASDAIEARGARADSLLPDP